MSVSDGVFNNLRQKLDVFGYKQTLPLGAIPLVGALFEDLIKTTESLRNAKKKIVTLLEEKNCWDLGVEPYKCDNSRLLSECNQLHLLTLKQQEDFEKRACDYNQKIRNLQSDKFHLEEQCTQLQQQLQSLISKQSSNLLMGKDAVVKPKKPFITTVRSGQELPPLQSMSEHTNNLRCSKCSSTGCTQRGHTGCDGKPAAVQSKEITKLENDIRDLTEQVAFYKQKVESRDREIHRLNELLSGGRPPAALAKDCCYKQVGALAEDIELLQREKSENLNKLHSYQDQMHEAMQRALKLEASNRQLRIDLDEVKKAALQVEQQANADICKRQRELESLKMDVKKITKNLDKSNMDEKNKNRNETAVASTANQKKKMNDEVNALSAAEKRQLKEQLNTLTQREIELKTSNQSLHKKLHKLKSKMISMRKELKDSAEENRRAAQSDAEQIRLKSERDFFQKEYLRLVNKAGSEKEIDFLQEQIKSKDNELRILRNELCHRPELNLPTTPATECTPHAPHPLTGVSSKSTDCCPLQDRAASCAPTLRGPSVGGHTYGEDCGDNIYTGNVITNCVQAVVLRAERERDVARAELERVRCERDTLRERHVSLLQAQAEEAQKVQQRYDDYNARIHELERANRAADSVRLPSESQIVLLKEEIEDLRHRLAAAQEENCLLKTTYSQLKLLHEQTERSLLEYQNKLTLAEHQLDSADLRLNTLDSNRETVRAETTQLRSEVNSLRQTYVALEREKDTILCQLDTKTQRNCELECELKSCREKKDLAEKELKDLKEKFGKISRETCEMNCELQESTKEVKLLRQQLDALKRSRDNAIAQNGGLIDDCSDIKADNQKLRKEIEEHIKENDALKKKICQYVQEIRKTEELLLRKEKEREEMLEQYRSLSQDTVALQGNNISLEEEAAEYKRQVADFEQEICALKCEIKHRNEVIEEMGSKLSALTERNISLQHRLDEAQEEKHIIKMDLTSRTELCTRLEDERVKLNAEIEELNNALRDRQTEKHNQRYVERKEEIERNAAEIALQNTRLDLENQLRLDLRLNDELARLRQQNESLMEELEMAHQKNLHSEKLIHEYFVQNEELRHNLTDDRFRQARLREQQKQTTPTTTTTRKIQRNELAKTSLTSRALSPIRALSNRTSSYRERDNEMIAGRTYKQTEVQNTNPDTDGTASDGSKIKTDTTHSKTM